ncbi:O-succinylbenzoic acid--CoA ligase [Fulvitalea axinellae]|uniref:O-succinylbenzoic acid--CoA ligase n=1 Tax=Fulvitalea axinellae TaxID=1182444 RepID=A0AAU9CG93_9BACT|nr:O-succinylbenzoic acid--CoA ligase [Fulvitalea axinellae]
MTNEQIKVNGRLYSLKEIKAQDPETAKWHEADRPALDFVCRWTNGQTEFRINTSGSTGKPKTIAVYRDKMLHSARQTVKALGLSQNQRALVCLNTAYVAGMMMLVRGLEAKMRMEVVEPGALPFENTDEAPDFVAMVPLQLKALLEAGYRQMVEQAGCIILGGAPVDTVLAKEIKTLKGVKVYATYGMTETVSHIALKRLNGSVPERAYSALGDTEIATDDRDCLRLRSFLTDGEWLQSNDIVRLHGDKSFEWLGRVDNVINSGGVKLFVETLEDRMAELFANLGINRRFFLSGVSDEVLGQKCVLFYEGKAFSDAEIQRLKEAIEKNFGKYERPKAFLAVMSFEESPTGKVLRTPTKAKAYEVD